MSLQEKVSRLRNCSGSEKIRPRHWTLESPTSGPVSCQASVAHLYWAWITTIMIVKSADATHRLTPVLKNHSSLLLGKFSTLVLSLNTCNYCSGHQHHDKNHTCPEASIKLLHLHELILGVVITYWLLMAYVWYNQKWVVVLFCLIQAK